MSWAYENTGVPDHGFGVHFVAEKREIPLYRFVLEGPKVAAPAPAPAPAPVRCPSGSNAAAGVGASGLGRVSVMSPMAEASQEEKSPGFSAGGVLHAEISGLKAELESEKAANIALQLEVHERDTDIAKIKAAIKIVGPGFAHPGLAHIMSVESRARI